MRLTEVYDNYGNDFFKKFIDYQCRTSDVNEEKNQHHKRLQKFLDEVSKI